MVSDSHSLPMYDLVHSYFFSTTPEERKVAYHAGHYRLGTVAGG